jgi:hypothetical protein
VRKHETITVVNHPRPWSQKYIRARDFIRARAIGMSESFRKKGDWVSLRLRGRDLEMNSR